MLFRSLLTVQTFSGLYHLILRILFKFDGHLAFLLSYRHSGMDGHQVLLHPRYSASKLLHNSGLIASRLTRRSRSTRSNWSNLQRRRYSHSGNQRDAEDFQTPIGSTKEIGNQSKYCSSQASASATRFITAQVK